MNQENPIFEQPHGTPNPPYAKEENGHVIRIFRRPSTVDETDRLGRELAKRLQEAGVTEE